MEVVPTVTIASVGAVVLGAGASAWGVGGGVGLSTVSVVVSSTALLARLA